MRTRSPLQAEKILTAAARLFATHRFHEARMEDIASLAEVGKGTLYRYFKDKEELYLALLRGAAEGLLGRLQCAVCTSSCHRTQLVRVIEGLIGYFDENPHLFDLIQHAEAMQRPDEDFPWQDVRNQTWNLVKGIFQSWECAGTRRFHDPHLAVLMLLGGLRAVYRFGPRPRPDDLAERLVDGFLAGFSTPLPSPCQPGTQPVAPSSAGQQRSPLPPGVIDGTSSPLHNA